VNYGAATWKTHRLDPHGGKNRNKASVWEGGYTQTEIGHIAAMFCCWALCLFPQHILASQSSSLSKMSVLPSHGIKLV
jgi:hypothetical protein